MPFGKQFKKNNNNNTRVLKTFWHEVWEYSAARPSQDNLWEITLRAGKSKRGERNTNKKTNSRVASSCLACRPKWNANVSSLLSRRQCWSCCPPFAASAINGLPSRVGLPRNLFLPSHLPSPYSYSCSSLAISATHSLSHIWMFHASSPRNYYECTSSVGIERIRFLFSSSCSPHSGRTRSIMCVHLHMGLRVSFRRFVAQPKTFWGWQTWWIQVQFGIGGALFQMHMFTRWN